MPAERSAFNKGERFVVGGARRLRKVAKVMQNLVAVTKVAAGEFAFDERMNQHFFLFERYNESRLSVAEMLYPYRRVDEDHA